MISNNRLTIAQRIVLSEGNKYNGKFCVEWFSENYYAYNYTSLLQFSASTYIALADSDFLFSAGFYDKVLPILRNNIPIGSKKALLYRIFEISETEAQNR